MQASEPVVSDPPARWRSAIAPTDSPDRAPDECADPVSVVGLEFSLDTAPLDALEEVARSLSRSSVAERFQTAPWTEEVALLSTCHRVELALLVRSEGEVERWLRQLPGAKDRWRRRSGRAAVHHLFRVAAGLESLAVGEREVRRQVRSAVGSILSRHPRPILRELLLRAADAADAADGCDSAPRSIASVAAARLLELVGRSDAKVLVIGSGTVGRQLVERLAGSAQVTVAYHRRPPEEAFLKAANARGVPFDRMFEEMATADAIVTAAKFGDRGLRGPDLPRGRPLLLLDLGVPRNIDPAVRELPNVRVVDLEELHARAKGVAPNDGHARKVTEAADAYSDRLERLLLEPWVDAIRRAAEEVRRAEFAKAQEFLTDLDPSQQARVERLTQRLVARLMLPATERIRALPPGPEGDRERLFAVDLLRPRMPRS